MYVLLYDYLYSSSGDKSHSQTTSTGMQPDMETLTGPSEYAATK